MNASDYGSVKVIEFSNNITNEEIVECSDVLTKWASDNRDYAVITYMPQGAKTVTDLSSINKALASIKGSKLRIYGIQNSPVASFLANVVGQLLGLTLVQARDYASLLDKIGNDNPDFRADIEQYNLAEQVKSLA